MLFVRLPELLASEAAIVLTSVLSRARARLVSQARWCGYADTQPELGRASETVVGAVDRFATNHSAAAAASSR